MGDFGVSDAILLGDANSGQTSLKYRDLVCDVETPPFKNDKDLTMKLEGKYLFPTSPSGAYFIYQLPEGLEMRKILTNGIRMQKNPHIREDILDFHGFSWSYVGLNYNLHPCTKIPSLASLTSRNCLFINRLNRP